MSASSSASDAWLAQLAARGDRQAFTELVRRSAPQVGALLRRMGAQRAMAEDIAQDAYIAALRNISSFRSEGSFAAWTMSIAARLYLRQRRREARLELLAEPIDSQLSTEQSIADEGADLDNALANLSTAERMCISLCYGAGLTHVEIATAMQAPLGTVKSHVARGLRKLRKQLGTSNTETERQV